MTRILVLFSIMLYFIQLSCQTIIKETNGTIKNDTLENNNKINDGQNPYFLLKNMAFNLNYEQIGLHKETIPNGLYGIIFDWDYDGKAVLTFTNFITGDASLYFSSGACIIGGGQHEEIRELSKRFISLCENLTKKGIPYKDSLTTLQNTVSLYLLTTSGKFLIRDNIEDVKQGNSKLSELFLMTNDIITEFRKADEAKRKRK